MYTIYEHTPFVPTCYKCREKGHKAPDCPQNTPSNSGNQVNITNSDPTNNSERESRNVSIVLSDHEDSTGEYENRINGKPHKINMLLPEKVNGQDAVFEVDSGAYISMMSKDLITDKDYVPGRINVKSMSEIFWARSYINSISKVYKFGAHDNLGANTVLLGCDIGIAQDYTNYT